MNEPPDHTVSSAPRTCCPRRDDRAEVVLDELRVLPQRGVHVAEQDPRRLEVLAVAVVDDFGLVLGGDAGQVLALGLGDAELLVGGLHLLGQVVPLVDLTVGGLDVVVDVLEVEVGMFTANHGAIGLRSKVRSDCAADSHPVGLALPPRQA